MVTLSEVNRKFKLKSGMCVILHKYLNEEIHFRIILFKYNNCGDMWYIAPSTATVGKLEWIEDCEYDQIEVFKSPSKHIIFDEKDKIYDTDLDDCDDDETVVLTMEEIVKKFNIEKSKIRIKGIV